jgi:PAS domain S-box-containing protein
VADQHLASVAAYAALLQDDLADLYEHAPCGYLSTNADGLILKVNATFLALTGYRREELTGQKRFLDLLTAGGRIFYETHFRPLLRMQGFAREIALDLNCADGRKLPILVNGIERRLDPRKDAVIRITVFDATDRRLYERELLLARRTAEEAAQARSDLIAMVSHDVRAPLSAVVTAAAMLEKTGLTPQQARYLRIMQSSATHALTLLNSILDLSSLESGHAVIRKKPFGLRAMCDQLAAGARLSAGEKRDLAVRVNVDPQIPDRLVGDVDKIAQILMNLLGNAIKFTERGFVSLLVAPREINGDRVTLEFAVSDTGIGIAAERLPFIFNEFTQASAEIGEKYGGTGLGLAIARKMLRLHGSDLQVASTLGQGTTFSFALELARDPRADGEEG